ncbi:MAG: TolC family protein [Myxococcales bacterium]|nr:TolC family protein [Myxococcales bacterium]MDH3484295.1 TolC family protein [Myxococcales bacterium]
MPRKILAALIAVSALGCNYKKATDIPAPVSVPETYTEGDEQAPEPAAKSDVEQIRDARWWRYMGDPTLSALIEEALRRNQTVRAGWARVRQSKYIANQVRAAQMPRLGAAGEAAIGKSIQAFGDFRFRSARGSLPVSYEVDLFARRAREHQGAKLDATAARFDQDALAISISAEVAEAWFDSINSRIEVAVVAQQLDTDLRFLELVELRYREGLNSAVDVHQQRQRVAGQRALLALSEGRIDLTDQRLSVLLGEAPGREFPVEDKTLPDIGPTPDVQVPAVLLKARPDVRAAQTRVEAEDRRLAAAIGARLPQLVLEFAPNYTWLQAEFGEQPGFQTASGFTWDAAARISVPIFDGLLGRSQINTERAIVEELVERYAETILTALSEVEGALVLERQERLRIQYLEDEFRLAGITLDATRDRYRAGLSDFLPVLTALATRQISELQLVAARRQLVSYRVQLHRALGGAWPEEFGGPEDD